MIDRPVVGTVLDGRYALRAVLGRGGMAVVWRADDQVLHRSVAVKVFDAVDTLPDAPARIAAEVRLLAGLTHPGLVAVYDAGSHGGDGFDHLVMELVDGESLRTRLDRGPMTSVETALLGRQLADALAYVHERGVVHRDVKPANILLADGSRGPGAKLTDFGIARILGNDRMTVHGTTLGTANYLSPEQATGGEVDGSSDVYSLGLVLLECLTARLGYDGHGVQAAAARLHRPPAHLDEVAPPWHALLSSMTSLSPGNRPPLPEVSARLTRLADATDATAVVGPPGATRSVPVGPRAGSTAVLTGSPVGNRDRRRGVLVPGLVVAGVVAALGIGAALVGLNGPSVTPGRNGSGTSSSRSAPVAQAPSGSRSSSARASASRSTASTTATASVIRSAVAPPPASVPPAGHGPVGPPGQVKKSKGKHEPKKP